MTMSPNEIDEIITHIEAALKGDNEANKGALAMIVVLSAAVHELRMLVEIARRKNAIVAADMSKGLIDAQVSISRALEATDKSDKALRSLHGSVMNALSDAESNHAEASEIMEKVLHEYREFEGTVKAIKQGIRALAESSINSFAPGAGSLLLHHLDAALGIGT